MVKLYAIPFDRYKSEYTSEGVIYNITNQKGTVALQYHVSHRKYVLHDLLIDTQSGAPSSMRIALEQQLNEMFKKDQWKIMTVFSPKMVQNCVRLRQITFHPNAIKLSYNTKDKEVNKVRINQNAQNGF